MEVILLDDLKGVGQKGATVNVKPGFARNFLLPRKLALLATDGNKKRIERERELAWAKRGARAHARHRSARSLASIERACSILLQRKAA